MAEWLHAQVRDDLGIPRRPGPALLVGLPRRARAVRAREGLPPARRARRSACACPAATPSSPSSRRVAIVAHHPQAVYFGMKSGFLPKDERQARDEVIAGTDKDPTLLGALPDAEPETGRGRGTPAPRRSRPGSPAPVADRDTVARLRRAAQAALDVVAQAPSVAAGAHDAGRARRPRGRARPRCATAWSGCSPAPSRREPLPFAEVERVLRDAWGAKPSKVLAELERDARGRAPRPRRSTAARTPTAARSRSRSCARAWRRRCAATSRWPTRWRRSPAGSSRGSTRRALAAEVARAAARRARPRVRGRRPALLPPRAAPPRRARRPRRGRRAGLRGRPGEPLGRRRRAAPS